MKLKVYAYAGCGTCRKALKYLDTVGVPYQVVPIREQPPKKSELERMLRYYQGELRRLFNTSSADYREQRLKKKLPSMTPEEAVALLSAHGNLVKRPFVLAPDSGWVGFNEQDWAEKLQAACPKS